MLILWSVKQIIFFLACIWLLIKISICAHHVLILSLLLFVDLVVASTGEDKKISFWWKNGQSVGTIPVAGTDSGDNIEVYYFFCQISTISLLLCCGSGDFWILRYFYY